MSRIDAIDKKKFFETIDSYNFKETEALSQKLIDKNALTNDSIFRIGAKALTMINSIKDKTQLKNAFKPFMTWFDFCFKHQQKQTPKNSIIYYGIMFCKSLIQEQILDLADDLLNKLQDIYPFLCENIYDGETERYLKYLAPLCYNQAINKELINRDLDSAIKLFQHGIKFYIKVNTNFYVLFNSIRVFELNFIRTPKFEKFYDELFLFLKEPILSNECKNHIETQSFSMKFLLALFVQFRTTSFSNDIKINPKNENMYFDFLKNNFDNYNMNEITELELGKDAVKIICLIKTYSAQFSQRKTANLIQENTQYEIQLNKKFTEMNKKCIESNKFFNYWLLANLFDLFVSSLSIFLNNLSMHPKFVTDSLVESYKLIADIYSNNSKQMFLTQNQIEIDTLSKSLFHKPIIFYNTVAKLIELKLKINTQSKCQNSKLLIEASEDIITNQNSYLKWLIKNQVIGNDDLSKHYMCFENQTIRITNQIYSDSSINNYIKFQAQTSLITIDRLKFFYKINDANRFDSNLMKNFRSVFENLLLSLRLEEKYPHALEQIKVIYTFLNENNNIENEIEWLMANWCKIKRDMWRSKKVPYTDSQKKQTIADYLDMPKKSEIAVKLLFEEIRNYYGFKSVDCNIAMYQEIFHTIEKLETMTIKDMLINGRLFLEMAQFNWSGSTKKLVLDSQEYVALAEECLNDHRCISEKMTNLTLNENFFETDENKENDDLKNILKNNKKRLSSPNSEVILIDDLELSRSNKKLPKRQKRVIQTQSPMIIRTESSTSPSVIIQDKKSSITSQVCGCTMSKILKFQISLYTCLCHYSSLRTKMLDAMKNLVDSRLKLKDKANVLTNADNLYLQTPCTQSLICPEICDEFTVNVDDTELIKKLDSCLNILEEINKSHSLKKIDKTLEKQFYEFVDILAQFYGFLGLILNRSKCLSIKFDILSKHIDQSSQLETIYSNTVINLMKSYLNTCQIDNMECFLKKLFNPDQASQTKTSIKSYDDLDLKQLYEKNSYLLNKPEFQVAYYLNLMHYLILKNKTKEAIKIMKEKILKSPVLSGKQNAYFFETKHCLKYLQFTLSMMNLGKSEDEFMSLIENETPLSLLEECYTCIFSVAKYYTLNSIDPFRFLSSNANQIQKKPETVFFDIGNAESYRILGECLDLTNHLCKHFIDIGRYRDATAYIREGLDVSQLHFSLRRLANFLILQVHADIIANCFSDSQTRLQIVGNLVKTNEIEITTKMDSELANDLMRINNFVYHSQMSLLNEIRKLSDEENDDLKGLITSKKNFIFKNFATDSTISNYIKEFLIDLELLSLNYFKKNYLKSKSLVNECIKNLKHLLKNGSIKEKWKNAEYLSNLYELDETNRDYLSQAYNYIRKYPHPLLYRKILMQMYNSEASGKNDLKKKCFYLLETQSIALRHKACSIQYKHRRKGTQDAKLIDVLLSNLSFDSVNYLDEFIDEILPENCVVISLVLDEMDGLYVARFESKKEPILVKLKYDRKLSEEFKTIMVDNDRSMKQSDRTKFWSSRSALNKKLSHYLEEFESNVFSVYKSLLLGSYIDINVDKIIEEFKEKFFPNSKLNKNQENLLRLIILGLEEYSTENVMQCLKLEFKNVCYEEMSDYFFIYVRPKIQNAKRKHVCLLIDKNLHQIPFECFPTVISQPITRMPSIHFLQNHIKINSLLLNKEKAFYIVDPGCDLAHTRLKFKSLFEKRKTWDGIVGVAPDETIFKKALTEYELFIYTGHGSGSQYYPSDDVQKLRVQACSILMGCSSGNQYVMGDFEPYGTVLAYILAGCPCIVGNLWDVTDRDIDRLTEEFLESWIKDHDEMCDALNDENNKLSNNSILTNSICVHLNKARKACKMSYLNGSAPIVYGLPVNFK